MLHNQQQKPYLIVVLAVTIDAAMPFVKATYNLEVDGPLSLTCYETISALNAAARQANYPNLQALACDLSAGDPNKEEELSQYAKSCVQPVRPARNYLLFSTVVYRLSRPSKQHTFSPHPKYIK